MQQISQKDVPADSLPRCLVKLPKPPNDTGDCMPLASPNYRKSFITLMADILDDFFSPTVRSVRM